MWYNNGILEIKRYYISDVIHGLSEQWYYNGKLESRSYYNYGECIYAYQWCENGMLNYRKRIIKTNHIREENWWDETTFKRSQTNHYLSKIKKCIKSGIVIIEIYSEKKSIM